MPVCEWLATTYYWGSTLSVPGMFPEFFMEGMVMLELYSKYRRVMARLRSEALGNEIDRIAADLSGAGYKPDSAKLYLARIARFSAYATECGCSKSTPIPRQIVDRYLQARPTQAARWAAQG